MYKIYHIFSRFNTNDLIVGKYFILFNFRILLSSPVIEFRSIFLKYKIYYNPLFYVCF